MRIITVGLFTTFVVAVAYPPSSLEQEKQVRDVTQHETVQIDPITTGATVSSDHMIKWEAERKRYLDCPECVASQPFPED